ncbi:MAG: FAD-dependent oxidoreductase [Chloroflexi bacterium]|nr:FAD-dependent oxidoreductase [Chloroflexota bacterium]
MVAQVHELARRSHRYDLVVVGGGMAGCAAAITAARRGVRTALVQDRPVLGGNGSKEIRVWLLGANGGGNNAYFRETGLMEELRLENLYRNPEGNAEIWDTVLLERVLTQDHLDIFLNTIITDVATEPTMPAGQEDSRRITRVSGYTLASELRHTFEAPLFVDATGDGTVALLAGATYRTGREASREFGETLAPEAAEPYVLGGTIMFQAKDTGKPVRFVPPSWAHRFAEDDLRHRRHSSWQAGIQYWWIEHGGAGDTIHDNEAVKFELLRILYGIWDHLKNGEEHRHDTETQTLEWAGVLPGKRESRRFMGDYLLTERDILEQVDQPDRIAYGGWNIDHHPPHGFWAKDEPPAYHFHQPGIYSIPYRSLYARDVANLFLAGRHISTSHVAMCSTRVMLTCAQGGEAVGAAAARCLRLETTPRGLYEGGHVAGVQQDLLKDDHYIIGVRNDDPADLARHAAVAASSAASAELTESDGTVPLDRDRLLMVPYTGGSLDGLQVLLDVDAPATLRYARYATERYKYYPTRQLDEGRVTVAPGYHQWVRLPLPGESGEVGFHFLELKAAPGVQWHTTTEQLAGVRSLVPRPSPDTAGNRNPYSRWTKLGGHGQVGPNYCFRLQPAQRPYGPQEVTNGYQRPHVLPNLWTSQRTAFDAPEWLELAWDTPQTLYEVRLYFNSDLDRHLSNVWVEYPDRVIPDLVRDYRLECHRHGRWHSLVEVTDNHQRLRVHTFAPVAAERLRLLVLATNGSPHAQLYELRVY